jgi:hypothetical protein
MKKLLCLMVAVGFVLCVTTQAMAIMPQGYWNFNNDNGETAGTYDGQIEASGGTNPIDMNLEQYNAISPSTYFSSVLDPYFGYTDGTGSTYAPEHYEAAPPSAYANVSSYHYEGGIGRTYDDITGSPDSGPLDPQLQPVLSTYAYKYSYRDVSEAYGAGTAYDSNSGLGASLPNGGRLSYAFWLKINGAGSYFDGNRFGSGASFIIGRDSTGGYGGVVQATYAGLDGNGQPQFKLQVREGAVKQLTNPVTQYEWHHWVVEYDLTGAGEINIWKDGAFEQQFTSADGITNEPITGLMMLNQVAYSGANWQESGDFNIDDLAVYVGYDMTDARVQEIYNNGVPEPSSIVLVVLGLLSGGLYLWRRR